MFLEKLEKEETRQNKAMGTGHMLGRFSKLRAELEVLRKQQKRLVCNGRHVSGMLQYSNTLLKQAGMEVGGESSTSIIEQLQLPLPSSV